VLVAVLAEVKVVVQSIARPADLSLLIQALLVSVVALLGAVLAVVLLAVVLELGLAASNQTVAQLREAVLAVVVVVDDWVIFLYIINNICQAS
jgi:hypothetical protein